MEKRVQRNEPLAYTVTGACDAAGIRSSKLYEEIAAGRLRAKKAGSRTLIMAEDLRSWLASLPDGHCTYTKP